MHTFLRKIKSLGYLPEGTILLAIDFVVIYYPNIQREEDLVSLRRSLNARTEEKVTTETLVKLAEIVLKNNILSSMKKLFTANGT